MKATDQAIRNCQRGCPADTTPVPVTSHGYDSADRAQDSGYRYDVFGRVTIMPDPAGEVSHSFFVNELVASQTQSDQRMRWTLDPALRLRSYRAERLVNGTWSNAVTKVNHYGDDTDEPRWITEDATLPDALTRNISGGGWAVGSDHQEDRCDHPAADQPARRCDVATVPVSSPDPSTRGIGHSKRQAKARAVFRIKVWGRHFDVTYGLWR